MTPNLADRLEAFIPRGDGYNSDYANTLTEAVEALRATPAEPVQEPVGIVEPFAGVAHAQLFRDLPAGTKLYAAPQPSDDVASEPDVQSELNEARTSIAHLLIELDAVPKWISVEERMPDGVVLAYYENSYNKSRIIRAQYVKKFTQESENIDDFDAQYDEETDTYYDAEGWYEMIDNWPDYSSVTITEGTVTHWMPLPATVHVSLTDEGKA